MTSLLAYVPLVLLLFLTMLMLLYTLRRLRFQADWSTDVQSTLFRDRMRKLSWLLVGGTTAAPLFLSVLAAAVRPRPDIGAAAVFLLAIPFTVALSVKAHELRRLDFCGRHLPLFRRLAGTIPALYAFAMATVLGGLLADALRPGRLSGTDLDRLLATSLVAPALAAGCLGTLRRTLLRRRPVPRNLAALIGHTLLAATPAALLLALAAPGRWFS